MEMKIASSKWEVQVIEGLSNRGLTVVNFNS